ncbi:MAG: transglutaminase family protein [Verrucomicrobiae bacterium]|nr:transglutaminase family protein [Verrucomicrobiae bacterium]
MRLRVHHRTEYRYPEPVSDSVNELRLYPPDTRWQKRQYAFVSVLPASRLRHYEDLNQNRTHWFEIARPHQRLVIESRAEVVTRQKVNFSAFPYGFHHDDLPRCRFREECYPFLQESAYVERTPEIWRRALDIRGGSTDVFQTSYAIMEHIYREFRYQSGATTVATRAGEVIEKRTGVCQDFAHAMVAFCRAIGIPARYVSGYFFDATRDHHLRGSEASHAWVEVYLESFGWIGLDPTNNKVVDETYLVVATGRDYREVAPVAGTYYGAGGSLMEVSVSVRRLPDGPVNGGEKDVRDLPGETVAVGKEQEPSVVSIQAVQ